MTATATEPAVGTDPTPAAPPAPAPAPPATGTAPAAEPTADVTDWKAEAERWKRQARQNEDRSKANHADLQARDALLKQVADKLGIPFDGKPDPDALTAKLEAQTALARSRAIELGVLQAAAGRLDAGVLIDSREFMRKAEALDPDAADFRDRVSELVTEAASQPRYQFQRQAPAEPAAASPAPQAGPPASSSGGNFNAAPGGNRLWTEADYQAWVTGGQDPAVIDKAMKDGLLVNLGIGKPKPRR